METCSMCFKTKDLRKAHSDAADSAMVCAGCSFDIQRVAGYLSFHGAVIVSATEGSALDEMKRARLEETADKPPLPPKSRSGK